ncbi:MAG TPA: RNA polymerase sigma factor [Solirubrobacteraceae bacterium]|nr:RNA polymerase sigma factor [Solirubrobacteraceae bacterium]
MRPEAATEAELVSLALAGNAEALAALLERCRPSLYAAAIGLLGNRDDALDALQDTYLTALLRLGELRDPAAARAWLHAVVRNACLMRVRRRRELPFDWVEHAAEASDPEEMLEANLMRDWVWQALEALPLEERIAVMLRYFTRCVSYEAIARVTGVPVGTVRSRLNRARTRLADELRRTITGTALSHAELEANERDRWEDFYGVLQQRPVPRTYRDVFVPAVDVSDRNGRWVGIDNWSAHEREAIVLGVRAQIVGLLAAADVTVLEIDFTNPPTARYHCPPQATFVHRLDHGRSRHLRIHYPVEQPPSKPYAETR